jgi:hypothetical protein
MTDFEQILDDCIEKMLSGEATLEECLRQYPAEAAALEPLLQKAAELQRSVSGYPSPEFKARTRAELKRRIQSRSRGGSGEEKNTGGDASSRQNPDRALSMGMG